MIRILRNLNLLLSVVLAENCLPVVESLIPLGAFWASGYFGALGRLLALLCFVEIIP